MGGVVSAETVPFLGGQSSGPGVLAKIGLWVVNNIGGLFQSVRDNAKANKAMAIANAGGYDTLTPYQKSLIIYSYSSVTCTDPAVIKQPFTVASVLSNTSLISVLVIVTVSVVLFLFFMPVPAEPDR